MDRKKMFNDFVSSKPSKSGNYVTKDKNGKICTDDYTTTNGGHWWNESNDVSTMYSPSSYREL